MADSCTNLSGTAVCRVCIACSPRRLNPHGNAEHRSRAVGSGLRGIRWQASGARQRRREYFHARTGRCSCPRSGKDGSLTAEESWHYCDRKGHRRRVRYGTQTGEGRGDDVTRGFYCEIACNVAGSQGDSSPGQRSSGNCVTRRFGSGALANVARLLLRYLIPKRVPNSTRTSPSQNSLVSVIKALLQLTAHDRAQFLTESQSAASRMEQPGEAPAIRLLSDRIPLSADPLL